MTANIFTQICGNDFFCWSRRWIFLHKWIHIFHKCPFCQGSIFVYMSNFECSLGRSEMFVHRSMLSVCLGNFLTNGTPCLWGGIAFMSLHQVKWFKLLQMCPKVGHKFSLEPIHKKTTLSVHFFLKSLCLVTSITLPHFYSHYVRTFPPFHQQTILQSPYIGLYVICWPIMSFNLICFPHWSFWQNHQYVVSYNFVHLPTRSF
jgi:hypothetical protein